MILRQFLFALLASFLLPITAGAQDSDSAEDASIFNDDIFETEGESTAPPQVTAAQGVSVAPAPQPAPAPTTSKMPSGEEYEDLLKRMNMMEADIEQLLGAQDRLKEQKAMDRLNWSGSYRFNFNYFHLRQHDSQTRVTHLVLELNNDGSPAMGEDGAPSVVPQETTETIDREDWLAPSWTHRLKLAMTYDFGESLRFYSQLGVYKYFNEELNTIGSIDHGANAYPRDNSFRLERVYFDWFVAKRLSFSVGRIASPDGPPTELKENADRRSGWGVQMVNATIDTVMATISMADNTYLRVFYSPFGMHSNYSVISDISLIDDQGVDLLHSWGALFEVGIPKMGDSIFQLGFLQVPQFSPRDVRIMFPGAEAPTAPSAPDGDNLGMYMGANSLLLLKNILHSGLDLFAAYGLTVLKPTKYRMVYEVPMSYPVINPATGETVATVDEVIEFKTGLASYEEPLGTTSFGHTVYAGFRYTLPTSERYPTRIGGEYNWGTKYHLAWSHPNDQLVNKLGNKGMAFEGYIIQQLVPKHLFCRIGYLELHRDYIGQFVGPTTKVDQRIRDIYLLVDLSW